MHPINHALSRFVALGGMTKKGRMIKAGGHAY
jgi:hypothetical protein